MEASITKDESFGLIPFFQINDEVEFLLVQHASGHWSFPKGHPLDMESVQDTIKREFYEETGIADFDMLKEKQFLENYLFNKNNKVLDKNVTYHLGRVNRKNEQIIRPEEIIKLGWFNFESAYNQITHNTTKQLLKDAYTYLLSNYILNS